MADDFLPPLPDDIPPHSQSGTGSTVSDTTQPLPVFNGPPFVVDPIPLLTTASKLRKGTWVFNYRRTGLIPFFGNDLDGTFRFENNEVPLFTGVRGSGDMYRRGMIWTGGHIVGGIWLPGVLVPSPPPVVNRGIPIFPINQYQGYLRVTAISGLLIGFNSFDLEFEMYQWNATNKAFNTNAAGKPAVDQTYVVRLTWSIAPSGWVSPGDYLTGEVKIKSTGVTTGHMTMGWVSDKFRKVGLEIDAVKGCHFPTVNLAQHSVWDLLKDAGFQVEKRIQDESTIDDTPNSQWNEAEMHDTMLKHRQKVDLDKEWTYHALLVPHYTNPSILGIMYDDKADGADPNGVAREGFAVAAQLQTGDLPSWGNEANRALQDAYSSFIRTTIHELGHALGMHHPDAYDPKEEMDDTYQCQTWSLNKHAKDQAREYTSVIQWHHSPAVRKRLRHYPDIRIRPGGIAFSTMSGTNGAAPWIPPNDAIGPETKLHMSVSPLLGEVPIGAPVRVKVTLRNDSDFPLEIPRDISLRGQAMKGDVEDPSSIRRPFKPILHCMDTLEPFTTLEPGKSVTTDLTLFGSNNGPLFPTTGVHKITAILSWATPSLNGNSYSFWLDAKTTVMVTGARSSSHAATAHQLLAEPQTQLCLAIGGDHLKEGVKAIQLACDDETLGPHYAYIEAKRCAQRFFDRKPDVEGAKKLCGRKGCVMSDSEKKKLDRLCKSG